MAINFPSAPTVGQAFGGYVWDGQKWVKLAVGDATISTSPPAGAVPGEFWWDSDTGVLYIFYNDGNSSQWVVVDSTGSSTAFVLKIGDTMTGPLTLVPLASATPAVNGQLTFEATGNTQLKLKFKGSDGVVRAATLTLA